MNAGAMGGWIFDVVEEVEMMRPDGEVLTLRKSEMHVDYRHCAELERLRARRPAPAAAARPARGISRQIDVYRRKRHESQPREPSAGCVFKNPPGDSAGRLIDASGLKGERVGDAEVSPVHANFIVNRGNATSADVLELIRRVRARVRQAQGVELEPEVLLYGEMGGCPVTAPGDRGLRRRHLGRAGGLARFRPGVRPGPGPVLPDRAFRIDADALPAGLDPARHVVFSMLHGTFGEDGGMQALLEAAGVAYCGMRRGRLPRRPWTRRAPSGAGRGPGLARAPTASIFTPRASPSADEVIARLGDDVVVKPNDEGSSVGLGLPRTARNWPPPSRGIRTGRWLAERRIRGRELSVGILGRPRHGGGRDPPAVRRLRLRQQVHQGHDRLFRPGARSIRRDRRRSRRRPRPPSPPAACRDYARVDFILSARNLPFLLEINPLPGMKETSLLPMSARCAGLDFIALVREMATPALERFHAAAGSSHPRVEIASSFRTPAAGETSPSR